MVFLHSNWNLRLELIYNIKDARLNVRVIPVTWTHPPYEIFRTFHVTCWTGSRIIYSDIHVFRNLKLSNKKSERFLDSMDEKWWPEGREFKSSKWQKFTAVPSVFGLAATTCYLKAFSNQIKASASQKRIPTWPPATQFSALLSKCLVLLF